MAADPPLSDEERLVLNVLMAPGSRASNSTWDGITDRSQLEATVVHRTLRSLEERNPPLSAPMSTPG
jgi:hypothetical protein